MSISAAAAMRMGRLRAAERELVLAVALCDRGAHVGWLEHVAATDLSLDGVMAVASVEASGLVRRSGDLLRMAHPMMAEVVLSTFTTAMRRAMHLQLADAIDVAGLGTAADRHRSVGVHLAAAGKVDAGVARLMQAADAHERSGQLHELVADCAAALSAEPRSDRRIPLARRCALAAMHVGDTRAIAYWRELGQLAAARGDDESYACALYHQYWTSYDGARRDRLERAAALGATLYGWSARAAACLHVLDADYAAAAAYDEVALRVARRTGDRMLEVIALEKLGLSCSSLARLDESISCLRQAAALAEQVGRHDTAMHARTTLSEVLAENLQTEDGLAECERALAYAQERDLRRYVPFAQAYVALSLVRCGRVSEARDVIEQAAAAEASGVQHAFSALIAGVRAHVAVESGERLARRLLEQALELVEGHGFASFRFEIAFEQAREAAQSRDVAGALHVASRLSIDEPVSMARLALWLVRTGVHHGSDAALDRACALRRGICASAPVTQLMLREIDATLDAWTGAGSEALGAVVEAWTAAGRPLDAMRAQSSLALARMRHGRHDRDVALLRESQLCLSRAGALGEADVVSVHLRKLGRGSRARTRESQVANLTERELQVARLVAQGMRNCDVAERLFLKERTVAAHLSRVYGKLGVDSRSRVAAWLQQHDSQLTAAGA